MNQYSSTDAVHYQENSSFQEKLAQEIRSYHRFSPTDIVLDIGCGDGKITAEIANQLTNGSILGIDASHEMIALAKSSFMRSNLNYQQANAEAYHGSEQYTVITSFSCLHWVKDIQTALNNIYTALKPKGYFLALTYLAESPYYYPFIKALDLPQWKDEYKNAIFQYMLKSDALIQSLTQLGFKNIKTEPVEAIGVYQNEEAYVQYVKGWLPCVLEASPTKLNAYLHDVVSIAKRKFSNSDGSLSIPYTKLHIYMQK